MTSETNKEFADKLRDYYAGKIKADAEIKAYLKQFIPDTWSHKKASDAPACRLSYGTSRPPKCGHKECWNYYFEHRPGVLTALRTARDQHGFGVLEASVGSKMVTHFIRYERGHDGN